ncbi:MAG: bifunctional 3,4-dihydroxy-2-butanone-4-phosphate synthase/GTP cyclohydrolase II [bacterium JZ-2024 1]
MPFSTIEEALEDIRQGKFVIVVDDEERENEGDLIIAAEKVTPEAINFMAKEARGLICVSLLPERTEELQLPLMAGEKGDGDLSTAFTVSVDAREGVTTGISAYDRYQTIKKLIDPKAKSWDFIRPGHIFPLRARPGGVLERAGHTEASLDLARLCGLYPAGVMCEIMKDDGTMARLPDLENFAQKHSLKIISISDLIEYRLKGERLVEKISTVHLPTEYGNFFLHGYREKYSRLVHLALTMGTITPDEPVLVRVQSECLTGDVFGSLRCDCAEQKKAALQKISREGRGVFVYMRQEGRGIGLHDKIRAYALQDQGLDTVEANIALGYPPDLRRYGTGAQILLDLGVRKMRLMTNNPRKIVGLQGFGITLVETVPLRIPPTETNWRYLKTKQTKLGHLLEIPEGGS